MKTRKANTSVTYHVFLWIFKKMAGVWRGLYIPCELKWAIRRRVANYKMGLRSYGGRYLWTGSAWFESWKKKEVKVAELCYRIMCCSDYLMTKKWLRLEPVKNWRICIAQIPDVLTDLFFSIGLSLKKDLFHKPQHKSNKAIRIRKKALKSL